jgi:hypothetical protein
MAAQSGPLSVALCCSTNASSSSAFCWVRACSLSEGEESASTYAADAAAGAACAGGAGEGGAAHGAQRGARARVAQQAPRQCPGIQSATASSGRAGRAGSRGGARRNAHRAGLAGRGEEVGPAPDRRDAPVSRAACGAAHAAGARGVRAVAERGAALRQAAAAGIQDAHAGELAVRMPARRLVSGPVAASQLLNKPPDSGGRCRRQRDCWSQLCVPIHNLGREAREQRVSIQSETRAFMEQAAPCIVHSVYLPALLMRHRV